MTISRLDDDVKIPYDEAALKSGDPLRVSLYLLDLVRTLQELLVDISRVTNSAVDLSDGEAIYSKSKVDGLYPIGTWRLIQVGDNWERQVQLTLNTWTFAGDFERPI